MASRARTDIARSLTLLRILVLASALILAAGAFVLGAILTRSLRDQSVETSKLALTQYVDGVLARELLDDGDVTVGPEMPHLEADLAARPDIFSVKVWTRDGTLAWTNLAPERIGKRFPLTPHLSEVLESGFAAAELEELHDAEDAAEAAAGVDRVLEVYAPVRAPGGAVVGAYEVYADSAQLEAFIGERKRVVWAATAGVFGALWLALALLARTGSNLLRRQTQRVAERSRQLFESYERLEESSLEAIETLNATVEAKDPDTAGHSLRVQRVAVALGEHLALTPLGKDALRLGALFHDIGKIAVPDTLLTKPSKLEYWEFVQVKTHSVEGARILGKLSRLKDAVPLVRHHHERWDGEGYPDGLAGDEIPLAACAVGLADAWDAMTTARPYHRALTPEEAIAEIRRNRGHQFAPAAVDAFEAVLQRRPEELGIAAAANELAAG
jgi:putative nucleotidyltransferase with HDIG domain